MPDKPILPSFDDVPHYSGAVMTVIDGETMERATVVLYSTPPHLNAIGWDPFQRNLHIRISRENALLMASALRELCNRFAEPPKEA